MDMRRGQPVKRAKAIGIGRYKDEIPTKRVQRNRAGHDIGYRAETLGVGLIPGHAFCCIIAQAHAQDIDARKSKAEPRGARRLCRPLTLTAARQPDPQPQHDPDPEIDDEQHITVKPPL